MSILVIDKKDYITPGDCAEESNDGEMLDWFGYSVDIIPSEQAKTTNDQARVTLRLVTHIMYQNIDNAADSVLSPNDGPDYVDSVRVYLNGSDFIYVYPLSVPDGEDDADPKRFLVDSEELVPQGIYGSSLMTKRKEYICEGTFSNIDFTAGYSSENHGFELTYDEAGSSKAVYDSVAWKSQTKTDKIGVLSNNKESIIYSNLKQRIFRINLSTVIDGLTAVVSPTYKIPNPDILSIGAFMNGSYPAGDGTVTIKSMDGGNTIRLLSEHIEPYEKQGGNFIKWVQEYGCLGTWEPYVTFTPEQE